MRSIITAGLALTLGALLSTPATAGKGMEHLGMRHHDRSPSLVLAFKTMYGVDGPFVGGLNPIRGVVGDEAPWEIARSVKGLLWSDGHLVISVKGLVFKDDPSVPPELRGKNDETEFRGLVSCLTEDEDTGTTPTLNVVTKGFPANARGDSFIDARLELPNPCVAPVVMVLAGSEDKWFAVTGFENEEN
jgi:hypothetical protein